VEVDPKNVKAERKKLYRVARLVESQEMSRQKADEMYTAWKAHAKKGNSYRLLERMDAFYKQCMEGDQHGLPKT
jgi:hypothetical protein